MDTDMSTKNDTIRLAGHCDAGCKMAIDSMDQISRYVTDDNLRNVISSSKNRHKDLEQEASWQNCITNRPSFVQVDLPAERKIN